MPEKNRPGLEPPKPGGLVEKLQKAVSDPGSAGYLKISLRVVGGLPGRGYHFEFNTSGGGQAQSRLKDERKRRELGTDTAQLEGGEFRKLLESIRDSRMLTRGEEPPRFLPDTVVGMLEITDGQHTYRYWFAADEDQASVQNKKTPPEIAKVVEMIYGMGARALRLRSIKP